MRSLTPPQYEFLDICQLAFKKRASDIHFEPVEDGIAIRFRIDGVLHFITQVPKNRMASVAENVKSLLGFDMSKFGIPQDTRFSHPEAPVDFRANLLPMLYGEKLCLRLLDRKKNFHLDLYPLGSGAKIDLNARLKKGQGLIIVSGPTGSGKSTLLYSALGSIDRHKKAIYTIEDPVEYILDGLIQIPVNTSKMDFSQALRALMRQDPDVIMVGELRDLETAKVAIHAANTGHLVLTTVHANGVLDIATRLETLGVNRRLLEASLLFASAQRLPAKLCEHCKEDDLAAVNFVNILFDTQINFIPQKATGCASCDGSGIGGRVLLFEYLCVEKAEGGRILKKYDDLKQQAFDQIRKGVLSAEEANKCFSD